MKEQEAFVCLFVFYREHRFKEEGGKKVVVLPWPPPMSWPLLLLDAAARCGSEQTVWPSLIWTYGLLSSTSFSFWSFFLLPSVCLFLLACLFPPQPLPYIPPCMGKSFRFHEAPIFPFSLNFSWKHSSAAIPTNLSHLGLVRQIRAVTSGFLQTLFLL